MTRYTGPAPAVLDVVRARNGGACLRCSLRPGAQCHHRTPRGMGGTRDPHVNEPPNLTWICLACHAEIESRRADAFRDGWLVRRGADPASQYLIDIHGRMLMLLPDGGLVVNSLPVLPDCEVPF
jgi:5-methylcytosine-specific restriction protein A